MAKFVQFNLAGLSDQTIVINAELVRCVKPLPSQAEPRTRISFDDSHEIDVVGAGVEVVQRLAQ